MNKHEKIKKTLKIVGPIVLTIGIILILVSAIPFIFMQNTSTFGLGFIGIPLTFIGASMTIIAFQREVGRYQIEEHKENAKYMANYMLRGTREEVTKTADGIKNGNIRKSFCPKCGCENDSDASFCKECGASLVNVCPHCGEENDADAKFCDNCGAKLK